MKKPKKRKIKRIKATLIVNPNARKAMYNLSLKKIVRIFNKHHILPTVVFADSHEKGIEEARAAASNKADVVIAVGGDGTINAVINGLVGTKSKFATIPWGTENVFAKEMGMPDDLDKAAEIIANNKGIKVDVGKVNNKYFLMWSGVGIDATIINEIEPLLKKFFGNPAYVGTVIKTVLTYDFPEIRLQVNRKTVKKGRFVVFGNIKNYGTGWKATPLADIQSGFLDVCLLKDVSDPLAIIKVVMSGRKGKHIEMPEIEYFRVKKVKITSSKPCLIHADGDVATETPAEIRIIPKAITLIKPEKCCRRSRMRKLIDKVYRRKKRKKARPQ